MRKVKAFTLTDVIVTMIIGMITIGMAFSVFRYAYNQIFNYNNTNEGYKNIYQLCEALENDFNSAISINYSSEKFIMEMPTLEKRIYHIFPEKIIRQIELEKDTFMIMSENIKARLLETEVSSGIIDELQFTIIKDSLNMPLLLRKKYSAEEVMELEEQNIITK